MTEGKKPRLVGINHVAIEVGDIDEALAWYGRIFDLTLRNRHERDRAKFIGHGPILARPFYERLPPPLALPTTLVKKFTSRWRKASCRSSS